MLETLLVLIIMMGLGGIVVLLGIGVILLGDIAFKTNSGRKLIREWFEIKPRSN